jgi:hypothetical protein
LANIADAEDCSAEGSGAEAAATEDCAVEEGITGEEAEMDDEGGNGVWEMEADAREEESDKSVEPTPESNIQSKLAPKGGVRLKFRANECGQENWPDKRKFNEFWGTLRYWHRVFDS